MILLLILIVSLCSVRHRLLPTPTIQNYVHASVAADKLLMVEMNPGVAHRPLSKSRSRIKSKTMASDSTENREEPFSVLEALGL